jgi:hypothetical protein
VKPVTAASWVECLEETVHILEPISRAYWEVTSGTSVRPLSTCLDEGRRYGVSLSTRALLTIS